MSCEVLRILLPAVTLLKVYGDHIRGLQAELAIELRDVLGLTHEDTKQAGSDVTSCDPTLVQHPPTSSNIAKYGN